MNQLFAAPLGTFAGLKVIEIPYATTVSRSWSERLFSWPWRPLKREKVVENMACPKDGEYLRMGNTILCSPMSARMLQRAATSVDKTGQPNTPESEEG